MDIFVLGLVGFSEQSKMLVTCSSHFIREYIYLKQCSKHTNTITWSCL